MKKSESSKRVRTIKACIDKILEQKKSESRKSLLSLAHHAGLLSDTLPPTAQENLRSIIISSRKITLGGKTHLSTVKKINKNWESLLNTVQTIKIN